METMVSSKPTTTKAVYTPSLAGRGARLLAALIDSAVVGLPFIIALILGSPGMLFIGLILLAVIQVYLLSVNGQSIGKRLVNIRIVTVADNTNGGFVTNVLIRAVLNSIIALIPLYSLIDVLFIFREDRRCLHDFIAGTKVVKD